MALPIIGQLKTNESTYIALSKAITDMDKALASDTEFYYSKIVAINLPQWKKGEFFIDLLEENVPLQSTNPNIVIPKVIQHYTENLIRQEGVSEVKEIAEIAFWKTLQKMGMSNSDVKNAIVFVNDAIVSNFIESENNLGWNEVVAQIPNKCKKLQLKTRTVSNCPNQISTNDTDTSAEQIGIYDNKSTKIYTFQDCKDVIDFDNLTYDEQTQGEFEFNCLLLFYRDSDNVDKLHGINFIYPYENKLTYWIQELCKQKTNIQSSIGYQFLFNLKTVVNQASVEIVHNNNEQLMWWNGFETTMTALNTYLEKKLRADYAELDIVGDVSY